MVSLPGRSKTIFDNPATYQIIVQGQISPTWSDRLEGLLIYQNQVEGEPCLTMLLGELTDQAALAGVLMALYEMHLPVLSVKRLSY